MTAFGHAPFIVIWETTRACALACVHCRAQAIPHRHPGELTTEEGGRLIDRVAAFGDPPPLLVLTGGDPMRRPDLVELVGHARRRGVVVSLTPSGTGAATEERLRALRDAGLARLAVSLDGATAEAHDAFRGVRGSHRHTMLILERARRLGLPLQINTTVCRQTVEGLPALVPQIEALEPALWALFFLIPVGRAHAHQALAADGIERVLHWAAALAEAAPFAVKTTEAPHYWRVLATRRLLGGPPPAERPRSGRPAPGGIGRADRAVTDGNGFVFVDHLGQICPSGFLPLAVGNVRETDLVAVYREAPLFRALRDPARLGGRCGRCEYRERCGGSRARAYAATGDPLGEDPGCAYEPGRQGPATGLHPEIAGASDAGAPADLPSGGRPGIGGGSGGAAGAAPRTAEAPAPPPAVTPEAVRAALRTVIDPELGLSVVELGLVYGLVVEGGTVRITMTLTAPGCPLHEVMPKWIAESVRPLPGVDAVHVAVVFDPPWTPARIAVG
ncbi:MAG TPA: TIGR04053 family radical SAM/SPASM domain-containing protein [Methylomirabilota bacterium]|nr:TIGR04053 family radical SAM/SPASM domain-containing protein [Methylomirabilota bacterium]